MKKILLILLAFTSFASFAQAEFPEGIQITGGQPTVTNPIFLTTTDATGLQGKNSTVLSDVLKKQFLSTGLLKNGLITINGDPSKFNISAGIGVISDFANPEIPVSSIINFGPFTAITPTYLTTGNITYMAVNSSGVLVQQATEFTTSQRRDLIILGAVIHSNLATINVVNNISAPSNADTNQLHDFMNYVGALNLDGNKYTANGANLALNKSAGTIFKFGVNFATDWKKPHELGQTLQTALTFRYRTQNGTEGTDRVNLNPALYDLNNVLTTVPNNRYTIQTVTMFQTGLTRIQYGQELYTNLQDAENAILTRDYVVENNIKINGVTRAYIILKGDATSLQDLAKTHIVEAQKFGSIASGGVALTLANIVTALGYTPENEANKQNSLAADGTNTFYPTVTAVNTGLALKANLASPTFTGVPLAPTATAGTNTTQIATTAFVTEANAGNVKLTGNQSITGTKVFINASSGNGILSQLQGSGVGIYADNISTGNNIVSNTSPAGTGFNYVGQNNGTNTYTVNKLGATTATSFINSTAPATNALLANGTTLANPISGSGTATYLSKFTSSGVIGNSIVFDDGSKVGIGTNLPTQGILVVSPITPSGTVDGLAIVYNPDGASDRLRAKLWIDSFNGKLDLKASTDIQTVSINSNGASYFNGGDVSIAQNLTVSKYKLSALNTAPASATDTGTTGEIRITAGFIHVCIATNTWVRAALTTWL